MPADMGRVLPFRSPTDAPARRRRSAPAAPARKLEARGVYHMSVPRGNGRETWYLVTSVGERVAMVDLPEGMPEEQLYAASQLLHQFLDLLDPIELKALR